MSETFEMPLDAKKGCLELAKEILLVAEDSPGLKGIDELKSLVAKVEASMDTEDITLEPGEMTAMLALGECSKILMEAKRIRKLLESVSSVESVEEKPELSQEQIVKYAFEVLKSALEDKKGSDVYKATLSLLNTVLKHTGGDCELTPEEHSAYKAIKNMHYTGGFDKE